MSLLDRIPCFTSDSPVLDRAFRLAVGGLTVNTQCVRKGLLAEEKPCVMAGLDYASPWTRDAAINVYQAVALLDPEIAENTLLSVLEETDGTILIGDQYWDRIIWSLGAHRLWKVTDNADWLHFAFDVIRNTFIRLEAEEFDPDDGLFRGAAVYGDGVSAYPGKYRNPSLSAGILRWRLEHPDERYPVGGGLPMKALSTNCIYYRTLVILREMAGALGKDTAIWAQKAAALKQAINRIFWNPGTGRYDYLAYECDAQEGLGLAFVILFGIADRDRSDSVIRNVYRSPYGIPCVWPSFAPYDASGYGRHSGTVWPHVQGFWAKAMLHAGHADLFADEMFSLARNAERDNQFAEIYHPESGRIYGGIQEGGGEYLEWRSCAWQTWSATALISMVLDGIFDLEDQGKHPFLPPGLKKAEIRNLFVSNKEIRTKLEEDKA